MTTVPVAKALILDSNGHMLILRRSSTHSTLAGHPDLPGGMIEPGEEPGQALIREIFEEIGLHVSGEQLNLVYAGAEVYKDESHVRLLYIIRLKAVEPNLTISPEHDKAEWLPIDEMAHIETEFITFYRDALHYIREHNLVA